MSRNNSSKNDIVLSEEQELFITKALEGNNILVDACIGSGKTTTIQHLCCRLPENLKILYLTYNRLLKLDAKSKIKGANITVTNYHGFAYSELSKIGIKTGVSDLVQRFNKEKPSIDHYDVLIIDEYQDIELELAQMLEHIKESNPHIQIIAVCDMQQKIYDKTTLEVTGFIEQFLGSYIKLEFTKCFRLSAPLAEKLGRIWNKTIIGVNDDCVVEEMDIESVVAFLAQQDTKDILCLGNRTGNLATTLNTLESRFPEKFNKKTVFASISDQDSTGATKPKKTSAIFTTYDSSKGLERKICVIFDFTESNWADRIGKPQQSYEILRNIFCVAASRGKEHIIFVSNEEAMLSEETLSSPQKTNTHFDNVRISKMFDFKYKENIEECFNLLKIKCVHSDLLSKEIDIKSQDDLIDLSPCIGIYQEAVFFANYNIDKDIEFLLELEKKTYDGLISELTLDQKILLLTSWETKQERYRTQVITPFVNEIQKEQLTNRLSTIFTPDEEVQVRCNISFADNSGKHLFSAIGIADVIKNDIVYELKYVYEVTHEHFLQCACYMIALGLKKGILYNTRNNMSYEIEIPDESAFLDAVSKAVTKNYLQKYTKPKQIKKIAVIDTETNFSNNLMSIGVVIADSATYLPIDSRYYILTPEYCVGGMYSNALHIEGKEAIVCTRKEAISNIKVFLMINKISELFAYNAAFDCNLLPELSMFEWYDIMKLAAYRQFNCKIPSNAECYSTGKLKRNYGVEPIYRMLSDNPNYHETHNAWQDALDELKIMQMLGCCLPEYKRTRVIPKSKDTPKSNPTSVSTRISAPAPVQHTENVTVQPKINHTYTPPIRQPQKENPLENYYTVKDVSSLLGKSEGYVYTLIHNGTLPASKLKNKYYINPIDYNNYVEHQRKQSLIIAGISIGMAILFIIMLLILFL